MDELIRKQDALDAIHCDITVTGRQNAELVAATIGAFADRIKALPPVYVPEMNVGDIISRDAAMERLMAQNVIMDGSEYHNGFNAGVNRAQEVIRNLPPVQPNHNAEVSKMVDDLISRQAAIDEAVAYIEEWNNAKSEYHKKEITRRFQNLPSAQPERTCVNCGRTANNGGWYADGRTRCPIEEHYALPKDGHCHLWEKRNVTDDDYPERREE